MINYKDNVRKLWTELKTKGDKYKPVWDDIERYTGIKVNTESIYSRDDGKKSEALDKYIDDPTAAISVNQAGDYLLGIMWGTGDRVFDIVPSRYVLELIESNDELNDFYSFATEQALYHMNHSSAGLQTALRPYVYDQNSFGTSGVGAFPNQSFINRIDDNALLFRSFGIDNTRIDEGKGGLVDIVFSIYHWTISRIIGEFCMSSGEFDKEKFAVMPKKIQQAYNNNDLNTTFDLVFGTFPRQDFDPKLKGKRGARYQGVWFLDDDRENNIFYEESYAEKPISMARQIKVRGEVYGRSSGTLLISSIKSVNYMVATSIEILEKLSNPALGMWNNAIFGDSVLDTSPNGITVFNSALTGGEQPVFQMQDVGDPTGIISFLIPYLNDKIGTAFKVDILLDFSSDKEMSATETLKRFSIRGKSLSGLLQQQKVELLEPLTKRCISILEGMGELGIDPVANPERAQALQKVGRDARIIPEAVLQVMEDGRPWYDLKFNNELEKLTRTENVQNLLQVLQAIMAIGGAYPQIIEAVNWYKLLKDINDNLDYNNQIVISEREFKEKIAQAAQQQQAMMALQAGQAGATIQKDTSQANKMEAEAQNVK